MTYRTSRKSEVLAAIRDFFDVMGRRPTVVEIGKRIGMSGPGVWKHVQELIAEGSLVRSRNGFDVAGRPDLSGVGTEQLRAELARRGVTLDALAEPQALFNQGRACAANHCCERVKQGQLLCRQHWFKLPPGYRSDITNAWAARQGQAFQEALERARNFLGGYTLVAERAE